jgi:hypothetical protein
MGLDVILEDEFGEELDSLMDETGRLGAAFPSGDPACPVLRFVDKEGTTLLNRLQVSAALPEFEAFARSAPLDAKAAAAFLLKCARRAAAEPHLYLRFFGD